MNTDVKFAEINESVEDQIVNLEAIKGTKYADLVSFMIANYSACYALLKIISFHIDDEKLAGEAMTIAGDLLHTNGSQVASMYARAIGFDTDSTDFKEASTDAKRIIQNVNRYMEHDK